MSQFNEGFKKVPTQCNPCSKVSVDVSDAVKRSERVVCRATRYTKAGPEDGWQAEFVSWLEATADRKNKALREYILLAKNLRQQTVKIRNSKMGGKNN